MRISVVTPNFNMGHYLNETIRSVLANLRPGDEYFVIDGASTDDSIEIIKKHSAQLSGWVSEKDGGYAEALAKGFTRATGDILCWINSGDMYLDGAFEAARALLIDDVDMIFGDDFYIDERSAIVSFSRGWVPDLRSATLYGGWTPLQDACFWRRDIYQRVGGIDASLGYAADYDLFLRMSQVGRTRYVPVTFSAFRRHAGQRSLSGAEAYEVERQRVRRRELDALPVSGWRKLYRSAAYRIAMSARSRIAPFAWRRSDLAGRSVASLRCGPFWPAGAPNQSVSIA